MNMDEKRRLAQSFICTLNDALGRDRAAIQELVDHRVPCSEMMNNHPTVQVGPEGVSMLGVINGLVGIIEEGPHAGWGLITAVFDEGKLTHFRMTA